MELRCSVELREAESGPGRLVGTLMRYQERASDRPEVFEAGALRWPDEGVVLHRQHNRQAPIMRVIPEVRGGEVVIDVPLPDTAAGRDTATEVRAGLFTGLSAEFRPVRQRYVAGVRRIADALLVGAGLVDTPSYRTGVEVREQRHQRRVWL